MQNVFFLPAATSDFLRLRCSSKRCGRRVLEDLAQMPPLSLVTAFKSKAKKKSERETHIFATITSPS